MRASKGTERRPKSSPAQAGGGEVPHSPAAGGNAPESAPLLIVGIGASAGGLEAFRAFFAKMPVDSGMAFVLVQHLAPAHRSILVELVAKQTAMPVVQAEQGMKIRPDTVFIIPPDATLTINDGTLRVTHPAPPRQSRFPIDSLFTSLAETHGEHAIGIVLAGTGSDGTAGVRAIKTQGGLTLAQAGFDQLALLGMPQSAAATGLVDHVMQVEEMPAHLMEYQRHLKGVAPLKDGDGGRHDMTAHLTTISTLLRAATGHDFGQYKPNTLVRRVQRRMQVLQIASVPEFIERLRKEPAEVETLFREFLIGVTRFFRDGDEFEALAAKGIPALLANKKPRDHLRVWVPGCSTGEEAYSIAMLLSEAMEERNLPLQVQIFATDIDDHAVAIARAGYYDKSPNGLSAERIERWFSPQGDGLCVHKRIREMCVFSLHNVARDPPFSRLDLISCRNLLIYFGAELQDRVVRTFHYALKPHGILFLGPSEGLGRGAKLFGTPDKRRRLFERLATDGPIRLADFSPPEVGTTLPPAAVASAGIGREDRIDRDARAALERHSPAYVVVNAEYDILRFSGGTIGRFLEPASGPSSLNLFALLRKALRPVVRAAAQQVFTEGTAVVRDELSVRLDGENHAVSVIAEPISGGHETTLCVIAFQDHGPIRARKSGRHPADPEGDSITQELGIAKAQLLSTAAELEAASDEIASVGEEYRSVNEELQSTNEELETAKEEMQSINEELQTVNAELNSKNEQLLRSNNDLQNLLDSTEIATIFLDDDLHIKGYTPAMTELFHLRPLDHGRPLNDIVSRLGYDDLRGDVTGVLNDLRTVEREVEMADGRAAFIMRIRPYRTLDRGIDGVVITFVDISDRRKAEDALREHAAIVEFSQDALIRISLDNVIRTWNPGAERLFGYSTAEAVGKRFSFLTGTKGVEEEKGLFAQARAGNPAGPIETICFRKNGMPVDTELAIMPIRGGDGRVIGLALSARGIADRKAADDHRTLLLRELSHRVKNALATVQAIASQTLKGAATPEAFNTAFSARLMALAQTHDLLTRGEWQGALLTEVIEAELTPYQDDGHVRWRTRGPAVQLDAKTALALGMAFHELATNAAKYGAFSVPGGRVEVTWGIVGEPSESRLHLVWAETGGPSVAQTIKRGFGSRLIEDGLVLELDGEVELLFDAGGVRCIVDVPLREAGYTI